MKPRLVSLRSVLLLLLLLIVASLLATAWGLGQSDDSTFLAASALNNERRTYNGTGNNIAHPEWGSVGQKQVNHPPRSSVADARAAAPQRGSGKLFRRDFDTTWKKSPDAKASLLITYRRRYAHCSPRGFGARELLSEVFLATPSSSSATSALFIGWGLLVGFDLFLNEDNSSEPLDIACNDASLADVWCPLGSQSESISFDRSQGGSDADGDGARSPTNYATAYVDLDWLYGRDEESAAAIRTLELGYLNLTTDELPHRLPDGTWLVTDQRPMTTPVTFALMTLLLREHNRCCDERASVWDADTDEDAYQVCRQWTIAVFQHITENDFAVRLVGGSVKVLGAASYNVFYGDNGTVNTRRQRRWRRQRRRRMFISENVLRSSSRAPTNGTYDLDTNAGADAVFTTVAIPAFYSALPPTIGLLDDNYNAANEHGIELARASADVAGLIERTGGIESIIRGAAYSRTQAVDVSFTAEVSASSPLFNLPVVAIQRGRDHGIPSYNDVREAYGLSKVTTFEDVTSDVTVQGVLQNAYGKVELLDAYTGALAESEDRSGLFAGPLLRAVFLEQLYRAIVGDRHHHSHDTQNEDAVLSTLRGLILNNSMVSSMALDAFTAPDTVALSTCSSSEVTEVYLADGFKLAWNGTAGTDGELMYITISARGIETQGMIAIGFGGEGMRDTNDFVICVVSSESTANCTDHSGSGRRMKPPIDVEGDAELEVVNVTSIGGWTSVTFARWGSGDDASDYPLADDIAAGDGTPIIYSWRSGEGIGKHPNSQRGDARVNFAFATVSSTCDDSTDYFALHGALLLFVWMLIAPYGIYQARYRKGHKSLLGNLWWEMHEECMVICAEALLPLAITAIFTTGGPHNSKHAKWGFYMIGAVVLQIMTGWARSRALLAKGNNFSLFHRLNKHFHIYSGWFAYMAGLVQCYRGLELVAGADKLVFSAVDIHFKIGNFEIARSKLFPIWLAIVPPIFVVLEARKQFTRFFTKGSAHLCCMVEIINDGFSDEAIKKEVEDRLMPRTEDLPLYTTREFNDKILNGRAWVIVDAAVIDVSSFAKRHPGGARLIMNSMGTDVTSEIIGEDASVGNSSMAFDPHPHSDTALEIARSLVVGYIEEEDDTDASTEDGDGDDASSGTDLEPSSRQYRLRARRRPSLSSSDNESAASDSVDGRKASFSTDGSTNGQQQRQSGVPGGKKNKAPGDIVVVGAAMTLSAQAAAIVNARSPVPKTPPPPSPPPLPPSLPARAHMGAVMGAEFGVVPVVEEDTLPFAPALAAPVSSVSGRRQKRLSRMSSMSFNRPVELEHPVERNTAVPSRTKTKVTEKRPKLNPIRRILGRKGTKTGVMSGGSGDESDGRQEDRYFNTSRRVRKKKNPLGFFHVCPLLMHEKMGDSTGRPVYKFVFACPGRAGTLVDAMTGVCHFHMRVAQEAGMTVVQRSYNAFAVRVQSGEGIKRVVPACETSEGELCIEMRIRIYPDGVMSNLLLKLAKNFDNPAVQLKGPFLQDRLIPPPPHRNIIMIAAGTGINPMVQMIRNYTHRDSRTHGMLLAAHSRLVLIWQNTEEGDLFCADELTMLQAKAKGLLEVTALISGDITRRNVPGNAFRHAKERLIKKSRKAGLVSRSAGGTGDTDTDQGRTPDKTLERATSSGAGGSNEFKQADAGNLNGDVVSGVPMHRHKFERELSRVTEEEHMSRQSSFACSIGGFGGRHAETGGGCGGILRSPNISRKGMEEGKFAAEIGDGGNSNGVPWSTNHGDRGQESTGDSGRHPKLSSGGGKEERGGSRRGEEGERSAGRLEGAREPSVAASSADGSTGMGGEEGDCANSGGGDSCSILRRGSDGEGNMKRSSPTFNHEEAIKHLIGDNTDVSSRVLEDTKTDGDSGGEGTRYRGVGLVDTRREASLDRHYQSEGNRMTSDSGRSDESGVSSGDVKKAQVAKSSRRSVLRRLKSAKIDAVTDSSDNAKVDDAVGSDDGHPSRSHRPTVSTLPSGSSLPPPFPSARHRLRGSDHPSARPGANTHSHPTARRTRRKWSRTRLSARDKMPDALTESPHEDLGGLQHAKLSRTVLQKAIGPDVMTAIASAKASVADASQEGSAGAADDSRTALNDLVGTETTGGTLQVVVSGPAGFVFCAEGLLAELGIPPQAVVMLD